MQVEKIDETILVTATDYLYQYCPCKRSLRTETKLSFRVFRIIDSGGWAYLPTIRLSIPPPQKHRLNYFPRHIELGCASVNMQAQKIIADIFSASAKKVYLSTQQKLCSVLDGMPLVREPQAIWRVLVCHSQDPCCTCRSGGQNTHGYTRPCMSWQVLIIRKMAQILIMTNQNTSIVLRFPDPLHVRTRLSFCRATPLVLRGSALACQFNSMFTSLNTSCWMLFN